MSLLQCTDFIFYLDRSCNFNDCYRTSIGAHSLAHKGDKEQILMHRWRFPSLSLHGIEGNLTGLTLL